MAHESKAHTRGQGSSSCACSACGARVTPVRGSRLWWIPTVLVGMTFVLAGSLAAVMPPLNLVFVPIIFLAGAHAIGFFARKVSGDEHCPECGKFYVAVPTRSEEARYASTAVSSNLSAT